MSMLCTLISGQMSNIFFSIGGKCPPLLITWGQMSSYTIFHRVGGRWGQMSEGANVLHSVMLYASM